MSQRIADILSAGGRSPLISSKGIVLESLRPARRTDRTSAIRLNLEFGGALMKRILSFRPGVLAILILLVAGSVFGQNASKPPESEKLTSVTVGVHCDKCIMEKGTAVVDNIAFEK